ncbi:unnamed protein product, partial [Mesorhabditis belari]|uniref:Uncharacterized protein n=1 Tax=Mesorhabditis belari TaxID=2138241 RepID=A0AAF3EAE7_9BILA
MPSRCWIFELLLIGVVYSLCPDTPRCIERIRELVAGPRTFWFGEHRRALCHHRNANPVECYSPPHLSAFHSLGSRLFRVRTYHSEYLRNLEIFPRITYRAAPGEYRACEHDFRVKNASIIEGDPDMAPVAPFLVRKKPEITWHGLDYDGNFTILMTDVGFGTLNYLVVDFPRVPTILKEYEGCDNFRPQPNPMALVVFRKPKKELIVPKGENFNLGDFMLQNDLADDLIGLSVVIVGADPYAIERQRMRGLADNCHSLIKKKVVRSPPSKLLSRLPLEEVSTWLSVGYDHPALDIKVCCQKVQHERERIMLDPLGDSIVSAFATFSPPSISSLKVPQTAYTNYHRTARTFVALMDELYTVLLLDAHTGKLHWMVVDLMTADLLDDASEKGNTKASYIHPAPADPAHCWPFVFLLLAQPRPLHSIDSFCINECEERNRFNFEEFKQLNGLRLSAFSWMNSCYDLSFAHYVLSRQALSISNATFAQERNARRSLNKALQGESQRVCQAFSVSPTQKCSISLTSLTTTFPIFSSILISILFLYLLF